MRKHILLYTNLVISVVIIVGFILMSLINYYTNSKVLKDDVENISKLTSSTIYSEIDKELTKPIFVSLTMANNTFLKDWLSNEKDKVNDKDYKLKLQEYLGELKSKYKYSSVFLVSEETNLYYHYDGVQKKVSRENEHDTWYYSFINSKKAYDLDVDIDEAKNNTLTIFVNCRIEDSKGNLIGVVGVGFKMDKLQGILDYHEKNFNLKAFLVNSNGIVQAHANEEYIKKRVYLNFFLMRSLITKY